MYQRFCGKYQYIDKKVHTVHIYYETDGTVVSFVQQAQALVRR